MDQLRDYFDRVCLLNLRRRPDRLEHFQEQQRNNGWPLGPVTVVPAVDGLALPLPKGFQGGPGGYGCNRTHCAVLEQALTDGVQRLLVLEDDAEWLPSFGENLYDFLGCVPDDWDQLLIGGQHHKPPTVINDYVVRVNKSQRTHCYAVERKGMIELFSLWRNCNVILDNAMAGWHNDHIAYAPTQFLVGQGGNLMSDISNRVEPSRWWETETTKGTKESGTFSHDGSVGDIVYHLVPIKQLGGRKLVLYPTKIRPTTWSKEAANKLIPLLEAQPYILSVEWKDRAEGFDLGNWRHHYNRRLNLSDMVCSWLELPHIDRSEPWLTVQPKKVARVIFNRSPRWRNNAFPWKAVREKYGADAAFIGLPEEHSEFCRTIGPVPYLPTRNYLDAAEVIAGAVLFVGNQSSCAAICHGLRRPILQESLPKSNNCSNCHWERDNAVYGYDSSVILPDLKI